MQVVLDGYMDGNNQGRSTNGRAFVEELPDLKLSKEEKHP
jgi:hypothetical protein